MSSYSVKLREHQSNSNELDALASESRVGPARRVGDCAGCVAALRPLSLGLFMVLLRLCRPIRVLWRPSRALR
ncbi:unnamed protein product, partial [Brenthis ino]